MPFGAFAIWGERQEEDVYKRQERLNSKAELSNEFRAYSTGYSFLDLYQMCIRDRLNTI